MHTIGSQLKGVSVRMAMLAMTGMDASTEIELERIFNQVNTRLGGHWTLTTLLETHTQYVVVDMDSLYGSISWPQLAAQGKHIIGLSASHKVATEFHLARPIDPMAFEALLKNIDQGTSTHSDIPHSSPISLSTMLNTPPPLHTDALQTTQPATLTLAKWLDAGQIMQRGKFTRDDLVLYVDMINKTWHSSAPLKSLEHFFFGTINDGDFTPLSLGQWSTEVKALGAAQSLDRLQWLGALLDSSAISKYEQHPFDKYQLIKWPQIERDYPRHFRIAKMMMMKGPNTLHRIANMTGINADEVACFIHAYKQHGYIDIIPTQNNAEPVATVSLFQRLIRVGK